jgi:single-strand DNA-binding protein
VERYTTDIIASDMKMLGTRPGSGSYEGGEREEGGYAPSPSGNKAPARSGTSFDDMDDDIPF